MLIKKHNCTTVKSQICSARLVMVCATAALKEVADLTKPATAERSRLKNQD